MKQQLQDRTSQKPCWTKEPEDEPLYSDWTITFIHNNKDGDVTVHTYNVHRNFVGPNSDYFANAFVSGVSSGSSSSSSSKRQKRESSSDDVVAFLEPRDRCNRIEFSKNVCAESFDCISLAFEAFLDFCYGNIDSMTNRLLTVDENVAPLPVDHGAPFVGLYYLCECFQIANSEFLSKIDGLLDQFLYIECRRGKRNNRYNEYFFEDLRDFEVTGLSVEMIENRSAVWMDIISFLEEKEKKEGNLHHTYQDYNRDDQPPNHDIDWSVNICEFIDKNIDTMSEETFRKLTNPKFLPVIHWSSAIILLKHEQKFPAAGDEVARSQEDSKKTKALSAVQSKCFREFRKHELRFLSNNKKIKRYKSEEESKKTEELTSEFAALTELQGRCLLALVEKENGWWQIGFWTNDKGFYRKFRDDLVDAMPHNVLKLFLKKTMDEKREQSIEDVGLWSDDEMRGGF